MSKFGATNAGIFYYLSGAVHTVMFYVILKYVQTRAKHYARSPICILGMRTRIFYLVPASQCVNSPTEAARALALLTAREARLPTNLRTRWKLTFLSVTN